MASICEVLFGTTYKNATAEQKKQYHKIMRKKSKQRRKQGVSYSHCRTYEMFGCKISEMTPQQKKEYNTRRCVEYQRRKRWEKNYGKNNKQDDTAKISNCRTN